MKTLRVLDGSQVSLLDALTNARGINNEPFLTITQHKSHQGAGGLVSTLWKVSYRLTPEPNGSVRLTLSTEQFPTSSLPMIQMFYAKKVRPFIEQLARKAGVSVQINLNYHRQRDFNVGIVAPK